MPFAPAPYFDWDTYLCSFWFWNGGEVRPIDYGSTEFYEWTGEYKVTNWRTGREGIELLGTASLVRDTVSVKDTALGIAQVIQHYMSGNIVGLAEDEMHLIYDTMWSCVEAAMAEKLMSLGDELAGPYRAYIRVNVYKQRHGIAAFFLGNWNRTEKRWVEVVCGRDYNTIIVHGYDTRAHARNAISEALANLPVRPGGPADRRRR